MPYNVDDKKYYELAEKIINGTSTSEEQADFFNWYNQGNDLPVSIPETYAKDLETLQQKIWLGIQIKRITPKKSTGILSFVTFKKVAAAVIFLVIGSTTYFLLSEKKSSPVAFNTFNQHQAKAILPGGNKAILTLADGSTVILDSANNGSISNEGNSKVIKIKSGLLVYQQNTTDAANAVPVVNMLSTPRGGQYQVELSDGSKVWLNASSSLKYPTFFTGKERIVELVGEGYFEVAKNATMPFKVKVKNMEVAVLGTHFNVSAYGDENSINTTLLEGSVMVNTPNTTKKIIPGQQAQLYANGKVAVVDADIEEAVAWKNGFFQFNSADMPTVIRQINRWYDVDIVYKNNVDAHFTGAISRSIDVEKVLKKLQLTGAFNFKINDKQVFITK